ncbi:hypothetical protein CPB83DRAFT_20643 [Crepidotus variabilis]|uniref:Uncharacterized protein n=1 Tax=Crepidotus variabilis TaxID=179855 RepID=A0A9P6EUG9_9AGAR|nr:hypothetical protein CPB83DRAFT_20643 [Crepidotus variabilis]
MGAKRSFEPQQSGSFVVTGGLNSLEVFPVSKVLSALPRSDLLLLSCSLPEAQPKTKPLPNSDTNWRPWVGDSLDRWEYGTVVGYRDFAGGETHPGTYDALSHLFFTPIPTAGSSGGPIIDKETGAVVGVILGSRMNNRVEGMLGWACPLRPSLRCLHYLDLKARNKMFF